MINREWQPPPMREFHISPKTPYKWFANVTSWRGEAAERIVKDVVENGKDLVGSAFTSWGIVLKNIRHDRFSVRRYSNETGEKALAYAAAPLLGSFMKALGCGMEAPPIVYVSGCLLLDEAEKGLVTVTERLEEITSGRRKFETDKQRVEEQVQACREKVALEIFGKVMEEAIGEYGCQTLPMPIIYTATLRAMLIRPRSEGNSKRQGQILNLLKQGKIKEAHSLAFSTT